MSLMNLMQIQDIFFFHHPLIGYENPAIPHYTSLAHPRFDFDMFLTNTWFS